MSLNERSAGDLANRDSNYMPLHPCALLGLESTALGRSTIVNHQICKSSSSQVFRTEAVMQIYSECAPKRRQTENPLIQSVRCRTAPASIGAGTHDNTAPLKSDCAHLDYGTWQLKPDENTQRNKSAHPQPHSWPRHRPPSPASSRPTENALPHAGRWRPFLFQCHHQGFYKAAQYYVLRNLNGSTP